MGNYASTIGGNFVSKAICHIFFSRQSALNGIVDLHTFALKVGVQIASSLETFFDAAACIRGCTVQTAVRVTRELRVLCTNVRASLFNRYMTCFHRTPNAKSPT